MNGKKRCGTKRTAIQSKTKIKTKQPNVKRNDSNEDEYDNHRKTANIE